MFAACAEGVHVLCAHGIMWSTFKAELVFVWLQQDTKAARAGGCNQSPVCSALLRLLAALSGCVLNRGKAAAWCRSDLVIPHTFLAFPIHTVAVDS